MSERIEYGKVQGFNRKKDRLRYEVRLDSGDVLLVNERLIQGRPAGRLAPGTRLQIVLRGESVIRASVQAIPFRATVQEADPQTGKLKLVDEEGNRLPLRLPPGIPIWDSLEKGVVLELVPKIEQTGKAKFQIKMVKGVESTAISPVPTPNVERSAVSAAERVLAPMTEQVGRGKVVHISAHYVAIKLMNGDQANLLSNRWPADSPLAVGVEVECRYVPERHEVIEVLPLLAASSDTSSNSDAEAEASDAGSGFDFSYFWERQREGHCYEIMAFLKEHYEEDHIEWYYMREAASARLRDPLPPLSPAVTKAIRRADPNFRRFYLHQARALDALRAGRNVLLVTQTASGKTLCYNPAIFETICARDPSARALYIFPLNALLTDQRQKIEGLKQQLREDGYEVDVDVMIGGMSRARRQAIARRNPHIIVTNPEMLGVILRGATSDWQNFFSRLRYVVIDEVHFYRGLLGLHMAGLLRRLLLTARRYGAEPQFVLSSATVSNPLDLAHRLTGLPADSFDFFGPEDDGSQQAIKHWAIFSPTAGASSGEYDGYLGAAALAMVDLLCARNEHGQHSPLNTILFAKSMRDVNKVYDMVRRNLKTRRRDSLIPKVRKYVGAELTADEKREIYEGLRTGKYVGVVSTNALEAGVDIGRLDACIIAGFPYTVMRLRQMAGRVGRHAEGLVLFVPHPSSAVDQFYRDHPRLLLEQPPEVFVVDPENSHIMKKHLNAAAYELRGLTKEEVQIFGSRVREVIDRGIEDGRMRWSNGRLFGSRTSYLDRDDPYAIQNIRSNIQRPYVICKEGEHLCPNSRLCHDANSRDRCRHRIQLIDQQYVYRDCHPGAIYEDFEGKLWEITSLDDDNQSVRALPLADTCLDRTFVDETTSIEIMEEPRASRILAEGVQIAWGRVRVTRSFDGYYSYSLIPARRCRRCRREFDEDVDYCPWCQRYTESFFRQSRPVYQEFPHPYREKGFRIVLDTIAVWMVVPAELERRLMQASTCKLPGNKNKVQTFVDNELSIKSLGVALTAEEQATIVEYHTAARKGVFRRHINRQNQVPLFPGIYRQCLMAMLRERMVESRARELFGAVTGYPVVDDPRHICRDCCTSVLLPAMHTIEHTVMMRYPSVALGDQGDLGAYTTLAHSQTGAPTTFWFDNYEGGLGAAEKIYEKIGDLLEASWTTIRDCSCTTLEGCPRCTQIAHCDKRNSVLSKPAAATLIHLLLQRPLPVDYRPFVYRRREASTFEEAYERNKYSSSTASSGTTYKSGEKTTTERDPYEILRIQRRVHKPVVQKAFEVRSEEISTDVPPISASELQAAYQRVSQDSRATEWILTDTMSPYEVLEVLPTATMRMVGRVYRVLARELHPDLNGGRLPNSTRLMQILNEAYDRIRKERERNPKESGYTEEGIP